MLGIEPRSERIPYRTQPVETPLHPQSGESYLSVTNMPMHVHSSSPLKENGEGTISAAPPLTFSRRLHAFFYFVPDHRAKVGRGHARVGLVANPSPTSLSLRLVLPCGLR